MKRYQYSWTRSYPVEAQVVGEIIERFPERTAEQLLAEARKKASPIHALFEWDNTRAAREYRLVQARCMIASLRVEVVSVEGDVEHVSAFVRKSERGGNYVPTMEADEETLSDAEMRCWQQMAVFKQRWKGLKFARTVLDAISQIDRSMARRKKAA